MKSPTILTTPCGSFRILAELGRGGVATVYAAENLGADIPAPKLVAVKVLHQHLLADEQFHQRFADEYQLLYKLRNRHIPRAYFYEENNDSAFFVMELVQGAPLAKYSQADRRLALDQIIDVLIQIATAMGYLYEQRVLHRDLKPENCVVLQERVCKLLDFGITLDLDKGEEPHEGFLGSPPYIAPERTGLLDKTDLADVRSDIYSFGILAFQLLVGQLPFEGENVWAILHAQVETPPPALANLRPDLPVALVELVEQCLAKDPAQRPPTPQALAKRLDAIGRKAVLAWRSEPETVFPLYKTEVIVGRDDPRSNLYPDIDLSPIDAAMHSSRLHARIYRQGDEWRLEEVPGVRNGTKVNSVRLEPNQPTTIKSGDEIILASVHLDFGIVEHQSQE